MAATCGDFGGIAATTGQPCGRAASWGVAAKLPPGPCRDHRVALCAHGALLPPPGYVWAGTPPVVSRTEGDVSLLLVAARRQTVGGGAGGAEPPPVPVATTIELTPSAFSLAHPGTQQLTAVVRDQFGTVMPDAVVLYTSGTPGTVAVSSTGLATSVASGTATITASVQGAPSVSATATATVSVPVGGITPALSFQKFHGSDVLLTHGSTLDGGAVWQDVLVSWGDGSLVENLRGAKDNTEAMRLAAHSYKAPGTYLAEVVATDSLGRTITLSATITIDALLGAAVVPWGRFVDGRDLLPPMRADLLERVSQPHEYVDATYEAPATSAFAATEAELTARYLEMATTGGRILCTFDVVSAWTAPARPLDGNGVALNTWIYIECAPANRPVGAPGVGTRVTPTIGEALPRFLAINVDPNGAAIDLQTNHLYVYRLRFVLFGLSLDPTTVTYAQQPQSGGRLVLYGVGNHHIVFDRCYSFLPTESEWLGGNRADYAAAGGFLAWVDCWMWGNRDIQTDSQSIVGFSFTGPWKAVNCFLLARGEAWMTGGARPLEPTNPMMPYQPRNMEIRRCHLWGSTGFRPYSPRYYTGEAPARLRPRTIQLGVGVATYDSATRAMTFAAPIANAPNGTKSRPNIVSRIDYVFHVVSGTGAGMMGRFSALTATGGTIDGGSFYGFGKHFINGPGALDGTSVLDIRLRVRWIRKNNGEFKSMRRAYIAECVFENGMVGDDSQYNLLNFKSTRNLSDDVFAGTTDIAILDSVFLNCVGVASMSSLPAFNGTTKGDPARRFYWKNCLAIAGHQPFLSDTTSESGINQNEPFKFACDQITVEGVTALHFNYAITHATGGAESSVNPGVTPGKLDSLRLRGSIFENPRTSHTHLGASYFDAANNEAEGNAVLARSATVPATFAASGGFTAIPGTRDLAEYFVNPVKDDLWGAADYSIRPDKSNLLAAVPEAQRLDWPRLKARTAGVRASTADIPYEWDY